jgi:hypothetical protein
VTPDFNFRPDRFERLTPTQKALVSQFADFAKRKLEQIDVSEVTMDKLLIGFRARLSQYEMQEFTKAMTTLIFGI